MRRCGNDILDGRHDAEAWPDGNEYGPPVGRVRPTPTLSPCVMMPVSSWPLMRSLPTLVAAGALLASPMA